MGYRYNYSLDSNPGLVPISEVKFKPVTEEYRSRIEMEKKKFRRLHKKSFIVAAVSLIAALILIALGVYLTEKYNDNDYLKILSLIAAFFLLYFVIVFKFRVALRVTGVIEATVTHRETHQTEHEGTYGLTHIHTHDHVTVRIEETGDEVSIGTDADTQIHSIPGKKVLLLKTSAGPIVSLVD